MTKCLTWTQLEAHSVWQSLYGFDSKEGLKTTQRHTQSAWHRAWPYLMTEIRKIRSWQYSLQCNAKGPYWWVVTWLGSFALMRTRSPLRGCRHTAKDNQRAHCRARKSTGCKAAVWLGATCCCCCCWAGQATQYSTALAREKATPSQENPKIPQLPDKLSEKSYHLCCVLWTHILNICLWMWQ